MWMIAATITTRHNNGDIKSIHDENDNNTNRADNNAHPDVNNIMYNSSCDNIYNVYDNDGNSNNGYDNNMSVDSNNNDVDDNHSTINNTGDNDIHDDDDDDDDDLVVFASHHCNILTAE